MAIHHRDHLVVWSLVDVSHVFRVLKEPVTGGDDALTDLLHAYDARKGGAGRGGPCSSPRRSQPILPQPEAVLPSMGEECLVFWQIPAQEGLKGVCAACQPIGVVIA
jgi:hypothetical protein